jgi:hypothetical protein
MDQVGSRLELRCRRKDLPPVAVPRVKYPLYWSTHNPMQYAYLEQLSETESRMVRMDGTREDKKVDNPDLQFRVSLTKEQAEAKVLKPKDVPTLPTGPDHELMGESEVPDSTTEHNYTDCNTGWRKSAGCVWFEPGRTVGWYRANRYYTIVFRRPKKKTTKVTLTTFVYGDSLPPMFLSTTTNPDDLDRVRLSWKYCSVLKTEEFEVPVVQK